MVKSLSLVIQLGLNEIKERIEREKLSLIFVKEKKNRVKEKEPSLVLELLWRFSEELSQGIRI